MTARWVELGRIGAPFGVKGWMHVDSYTDPPDGLLGYPQWVLRVGSGERITRKVAEGREHWVLATPEYLRKVEVDAGLILVDWPLELE